MRNAPATIDEYLSTLRAPQRALLQRLRRAIREILPRAEECISYRMPAFRFEGAIVAGFAARGAGGSYYPFSGSTLATLGDDVAGYRGTKGALHFDAERPLSKALVRKLLRTRIAEVRREGR